MNCSESCFSELKRLRRENLLLKQEIAALRAKEQELRDSRRQMCAFITEQSKQEEQRRHFQRLECTSQMVQGIAHEFNNLLQGMTSAVELLTWRGTSADRREKYVQQLSLSLEKFKNLVSRLLSAGRRSGFHLKPLPFDDAVCQALEAIEPAIPSNILINREMHAPRSWIYADPKQLEQALVNILTNAAEAIGTTRPGVIELKTEARTIAQVPVDADGFPGLRNGTYCLLTICDDGPGMDEETSLRAFDPFFSKKKQLNGTGLGLSIAYSIIKGHQGYIYCHSREGEGTKLYIFLPLKENFCSLEERAEIIRENRVPTGSEKATLFVAGVEGASLVEAIDHLKRQGYRIIESAIHNESLERYIQYAGEARAVLADPDTFGLDPQRFMKALFQIDPKVGLMLFTSNPEGVPGYAHGSCRKIRVLCKQKVSKEVVLREVRSLLCEQVPSS